LYLLPPLQAQALLNAGIAVHAFLPLQQEIIDFCGTVIATMDALPQAAQRYRRLLLLEQN
jgi:hypothetical protein